MARLNEPPIESVESLKRRFIRQNRELARNNSTQSVKIRNLETHISQLAAENVSLRATIIQLQNELDNRENLWSPKNVDVVRKKLEDKLVEFQNLVSQLNAGKTTSRSSRKSTSTKSPKRSPMAQKLWAERRGEMVDALAGREGWLPTIAEGKQFPRKTLDTSELQALISNQSSDSPDIGPPPRSSVDSPDRSKQVITETDVPADESSLSGLFSVNLESRRRRRETSVRRDTPASTTESESPAKEPDKQADLWTAQPVRAGSKRKLDAAYRPATNENAMVRGKDEFTLKANTPAVDETNNVSPTRRALAPKSVNNDPVVSPKKVTSQDNQPELISDKPRSKPSRPRRSSQSLQKQVEALDLGQDAGRSPIAGKTEPKTPAPLDLFSPESMEHSDIRPEGRGDTPPPMDLSRRGTAIGVEEASAGRTSRRARSGVNYAEPNLISKMRRPTKDLVDAVNQNKNRSSITPASDAKIKSNEENESKNDTKRTVVIKTSQARESISNTNGPSNEPLEPQSPLIAKEDSSEALTLERGNDRKIGRSTHNKLPEHIVGSDRQSHLEENISKTSRPKQTRIEKGLLEIPSAPHSAPLKKEEELDIFEVGPSPPRRTFTVSKSKSDTAEPETRASLGTAGKSISGTNLSSRPRSTQITTPSTTSTSALSRARSRRQTVGTGLGNSGGRDGKAESSGPGSAEGHSTAAKNSAALRSSSGKEDNDAIDNKITSRRRSMMV